MDAFTQYNYNISRYSVLSMLIGQSERLVSRLQSRNDQRCVRLTEKAQRRLFRRYVLQSNLMCLMYSRDWCA